MKIRKKIGLLVVLIAVFFNSNAQQGVTITLKQAIQLALDTSDQSMVSKLKVIESENRLKMTKTIQYPDLKISGQYQYLSNADIAIKITSGGSGGNGNAPKPDVHQLWLTQAAVSIPLFSGFKIRNTVKAENLHFQASKLTSANERELIANQIIHDYINLYKSNNAVKIIQENLKSAKQRTKDLTAMEENELIAKNDLLKANLQEAKVEIELEEAKKNAAMINFQMVLELKLPPNTVVTTQESDLNQIQLVEEQKETNRQDLKSMQLMERQFEHQKKIAKSQYYPSLSLTGGYINLDLENTLAVRNAMNVGVGFSYNLAGIFRTRYNVQLAKKQTEQIHYQTNILSDHIKIEVENAKKEHQLALKKLEVYSKSELQAIENYRIIKDKYDNDLSDINDLIEADTEQLNARINKVNAKADLNLKYFDLMKAEGNLIEKLNL